MSLDQHSLRGSGEDAHCERCGCSATFLAAFPNTTCKRSDPEPRQDNDLERAIRRVVREELEEYRRRHRPRRQFEVFDLD